MKNFYMFQNSISYTNGTYLPYAAGVIAAYALADSAVRQHYALKKIFCLRQPLNEVLRQLEDPAVIGFSCYVWNTEYNKAVAKAVKKIWPECITVFGGHNIPRDSTAFLEENDFADILVFNEGEYAFREILLAQINGEPLKNIRGIAFRSNDTFEITPPAPALDPAQIPSPYKMGLFEDILQQHKDIAFSAILETNRGCPYGCAFCDWCEQNTQIRPFPMQRITDDLEWMAMHGIEYCYCSDANFGILARDEEIVDTLIDIRKKNGFPQAFRVNFAKFNNDVIFRITQKLEQFNLSKGVTISFQSMTSEALENIGRKNMSVERFTELMHLYSDANIATYSEIILGLPGESYDDFCHGIGRLLAAGQHATLFIYNCELIINSRMSTPEYIQEHGIQYAEIPIYLRHNTNDEAFSREMSRYVVGTDKMSRSDWVRANLFSVLVQSMHGMGLLRAAAFYCYFEKKIPYETFYQELLQWAEVHADSILGKTLAEIKQRIVNIADGTGDWACFIPTFGKVSWPFEEAFYLMILYHMDAFYAQIGSFLAETGMDADLAAELLRYQKLTVKFPGKAQYTDKFSRDYYGFCTAAFNGEPCSLVQAKNSVTVSDDSIPAEWPAFAERYVWFGRATRRNLFSAAETHQDIL